MATCCREGGMSSFVAIDVETANAFMGSICQIGAVRFEDGREVDHISWLVDPRAEFDPMNVSIHGIDHQAVRGQPCFAERHAALCSFVSGSVAVCHTHFDRVALKQACASAKRDPLECRWLDSARVARRAWPDVAQSGFGLAPLARRFGIEFRHHDAAEDARAAGLILLRAVADTGLALEDWFSRVERSLSGDDAPIRRSGDGDGPLVGETIAFTGALAMTRREAADRAHELGAAVEPGVTRKTTLLVVGDQDLTKLAGHEKSSKHRKAEQLISDGQPIRILAESDFMAFEE
jgi:DNA polymerase-3 subunit epsilon